MKSDVTKFILNAPLRFSVSIYIFMKIIIDGKYVNKASHVLLSLYKTCKPISYY